VVNTASHAGTANVGVFALAMDRALNVIQGQANGGADKIIEGRSQRVQGGMGPKERCGMTFRNQFEVAWRNRRASGRVRTDGRRPDMYTSTARQYHVMRRHWRACTPR